MESNLDIQEYPDSLSLLQKQIQQSIEEHTLVINSLTNYLAEIQQLATLVVKTLKTGNKILLMGNGGSAADAQHIYFARSNSHFEKILRCFSDLEIR